MNHSHYDQTDDDDGQNDMRYLVFYSLFLIDISRMFRKISLERIKKNRRKG
jgi:hypothetical protein